jgi:hypothetical protein
MVGSQARNVLELLGHDAGRDGRSAGVDEDGRGGRGRFLRGCGGAKRQDDPRRRTSDHGHSFGCRGREAGERARQGVGIDRQILKMRLALWV